MASPLQRLMTQGERDATLMDSLTDSFARELAQVARLLNASIRELVGTLQTKKGRTIANRANFSRAVQAKAQITTALRDAGFDSLMASVTDAPLDRLAVQILKGDRIANAATALTAVDVDALVALKEVRLAQLMGLGEDLNAALWRVTLDGVLGARPVNDLVTDLADIVDVSQRQARVLYDTAVSTYSRAVGLLNAEGTDDELFLYVGPADSKTREFCLEYVGTVLTRAEIDELDNGIAGFGNVLLTGGGPNCRHQWRRVSNFDTDVRELAGTGQRVPETEARLEAMAA